MVKHQKVSKYYENDCSQTYNIGIKSTILVIIFSDFFMFDEIFLSPQVKRVVINNNKHGIQELPHELPNDLSLRTLEN